MLRISLGHQQMDQKQSVIKSFVRASLRSTASLSIYQSVVQHRIQVQDSCGNDQADHNTAHGCRTVPLPDQRNDNGQCKKCTSEISIKYVRGPDHEAPYDKIRKLLQDSLSICRFFKHYLPAEQK